MTRLFLASLFLASLAACGSEPQATSTARLDAVEVEPGTISDSMIILDDAAGDGSAVDNSVPNDAAKDASGKAEAQEDEDKAESETVTADDSGDGEDGVTISTPVAKKAPAEQKK
jgi:hypothetical protein